MEIDIPAARSRHKQARLVLAAILASVALTGGIDAHFAAHVQQPDWWMVASTLAFNALIFAWYYFDSETQAYPRSPGLNVAVVLLAGIAVPYYLVRSRAKGRKLRAIFMLTGFVALCIAADALGEFAVAWAG